MLNGYCSCVFYQCAICSWPTAFEHPIHNKEVCHENCSCVIASHRGNWLVGPGRNGEPRKCLVSATDEREREVYARNHSVFRRYSKAARSRTNALSRIEPTSDPRGSSVFSGGRGPQD